MEQLLYGRGNPVDQRYGRIIKACDRATALNLMVGLDGYALCFGIICEELNGRECVAIPYRRDPENLYGHLKSGYIAWNHTMLSGSGGQYILEIKRYPGIRDRPDEKGL